MTSEQGEVSVKLLIEFFYSTWSQQRSQKPENGIPWEVFSSSGGSGYSFGDLNIPIAAKDAQSRFYETAGIRD